MKFECVVAYIMLLFALYLNSGYLLSLLTCDRLS